MAIDTDSTTLSDRLAAAADAWSTAQWQLVTLAADLPDSHEWIVAGAATPAHHLAAIADVEPCTAREWIRVGKRVRGLPRIAETFADGTLSYSKVRALASVATPANEADLLAIAVDTPAGDLRNAIAQWLSHTLTPDELDRHQGDRRSVTWRPEADGMITFTLRLPALIGSILVALLSAVVTRQRPRPEPSGAWPTMGQQHADALETVLRERAGPITTEVVLHVRGDGCTADDGTPIPETVIAELVPDAFLRALIHDADRRPIDASARRRHPSVRQRRVVKERDRRCVDCGSTKLLEFDHNPLFEVSGRTTVDELELRCAPCHRRRHSDGR